MSSLRLFDIPPREVANAPSEVPPSVASEPDEDRLHASELYLAQHIERYGDVASAQAVLWLCDGPGTATSVDVLEIDKRQFPRTAAAVDRVRALLQLDPSKRPEGFWPRFLLAQFES